MELATDAPVGGGVTDILPSAPVSTPANDEPLSARDAASRLAQRRWERHKEPTEEAAPDPAPSGQSASQEADAAPPEVEAPGESTEADPADDLPSIDAPRSWTKEEKEAFKLLPPEHQQRIADRERTREVELRRSQNEAAEIRKAIEAERQTVEQAKLHYEQALPALLQALHDQHNGEFSDIKTMADVQRMADEDLARYIRWDAAQKKIGAVTQQMQAAQQQNQEQFAKNWQEFVAKEDLKLVEVAPELKDAKVVERATKDIKSYVTDRGITEQEWSALISGNSALNLRDHRAQLILWDAARYRAAKEAAKTVAAKPVPPVQRPGVAPPRGASADEKLNELSQRLDRTGNAKDATALIIARRAAASRRAS